MTSNLIRPTRALTYSASATLVCCYTAYRLHDRRDLSAKEIEEAHHILSILAPQQSVSLSQRFQNDETSSQHLSNLSQYGVSVVKQTLTSAQVAKWDKTTNDAFANKNNNVVWNSGRSHYSISKRSSLFSEMAKIGESSCSENNEDDQDADTTSTSSERMRFVNFWQRKDEPKSNPQMTSKQTDTASLQDIVKSYFKQHNIERYELTDVQFLNAHPESTNQIWHRDNTCCGLTAIIALKDVRTNGPTELLAGTHSKDFSLWNAVFKSNKAANVLTLGQPLIGVIDSGDAILYDARIFHRGRGFRESASGQRDRPVLVLRWDAANTPPPGAGLIKTTANTYIGCFLYAALSIIQHINAR